MLKISQAVIVEGKYDKMRLSSVLDALIIETDGFGIFNDREKQRFIKKLANEKGLLILTDSDASGFKIRAFLGGMVPQNRIFHAYIPDVFGKEKRKDHRSAEGKLGVEAMDTKILEEAIVRSGVFCEQTDGISHAVTSAVLFSLGLSGRDNSAEKRRMLLRFFGLPERLSSTAFLRVVNAYIGREDFEKAVDKLFSEPADMP